MKETVQVHLHMKQQILALVEDYAKKQGIKTRSKAIEALILKGLQVEVKNE